MVTMATTALATVVHNLRRSLLCHDEAGLTDAELLECFIARYDQDAFAALVKRHGPMVLGVCRRILGNEADAEDAFQATFLVLVRKAASVRPRGMVGNWLYGVAQSTALKARAMSTKRVVKEREAAVRSRPEVAAETSEQLHALLDEELKILPDMYRAVIVLCDLEGKSIKETAQQIGCPQGTVGTRLARGRSLLAKRLARHGFTLSGGVIATMISQNAATAGVPSLLMNSTVQAATLTAAGQTAYPGVISTKVAALTEGVLKTMLLTKLKIATAVLLMAATIGAGASALTQKALAAKQPETRVETKATAEKPAGDAPRTPLRREPPAQEQKAEDIEQLIKRLGALPAEVAKTKKSDAEVVEALFRATLKRPPPEAEQSRIAKHLRKAKNRVEGCRDILFTLVNTSEFLKLHDLEGKLDEWLALVNQLTADWEKRRSRHEGEVQLHRRSVEVPRKMDIVPTKGP
jgi:RNA polymerase sigma factor (sigma-70 family)